MNYINGTFITHDEKELTTYTWECETPKGMILIIHGMSEHAARYDEFATTLSNEGYLVYSTDLRGHGKTAGSIDNVGQFAMENGWKKVVNDMIAYGKDLQQKNPSLPLIILGHSMGSFVARNVAYSAPELADGYIFSATAKHPGLIGVLGKGLAGLNMRLGGKKKRSNLMTKLSFGDFNKKYENPRTEKDWLSRDEKVVDAYINDPYCMQIFTSQFYTDLLHGIIDINDFSNILKMNRDVPYLLFAGDMDPVGDYGKGPTEVSLKMKKAGIREIELKIYEGGRHEMLNETNKQEVYQLIIDWLNKNFSKFDNV